MELVTRKTPRGTPVGAASAKVVHLLWLDNGDDTWGLCDKKIRGKQIIVRNDATEICDECIDERDLREAREAGFTHEIRLGHSTSPSGNLAGSRGRSHNYRVTCRECSDEHGQPLALWSSNGGSEADAQWHVNQHFLAMYRAQRDASRG